MKEYVISDYDYGCDHELLLLSHGDCDQLTVLGIQSEQIR